MGHRRPVTLAVTVAALVLLAGCASVATEGAGADGATTAASPSQTPPSQTPPSVDAACPALPKSAGTRPVHSEAERQAFLYELIERGVDVTTLPRGEILALMTGQPRTPRQKAAESDAVFVGTVDKLHLNYDNHYTLADVAVSEVVKGEVAPGSVVPVGLAFRLDPNECLNGGVLAVLPGAVVLTAGDSAVFIASKTSYARGSYPPGATWSAGIFSEIYPISGDTVSAEPTSPYGRLVDHLPVKTFLRELAS